MPTLIVGLHLGGVIRGRAAYRKPDKVATTRKNPMQRVLTDGVGRSNVRGDCHLHGKQLIWNS